MTMTAEADAPIRSSGFFTEHLASADPEIAAAIREAEDECEEDLLVLSKQFDLRELLEDELLLELPLVPKHDVCPGKVKLASTDEDFKAALTQKPNAFAALGSLKKGS